jgi:hypothetical protein
MTSSTARPAPLVLMIYAEGDAGYRDYLLTSGFRVEEAHSGPHGFERASALRPDLIVLDFGLDGETTARLRRDPTTGHIPILALTKLSSLHAGRSDAPTASVAGLPTPWPLSSPQASPASAAPPPLQPLSTAAENLTGVTGPVSHSNSD